MDTSKAYFFSPTCILRVSGPDALPFLQGQFSNDLAKAGDGGCVYGLWLDRKGRMLADSFALQFGAEELLLASYYSPEKLIENRLSDYLVMDEVELEAATEGARGISLWGAAAAFALDRAGVAMPLAGRCSHGEGVVAYWGRRGDEPVVDLVFLASAAERAKDLENAIRQFSGASLLRDADIAAMAIADLRPRVGVDVGAGDLPQEAGLVDEAVSFTKGCYLGQEVMARLRSMGRTRRRLSQGRFGSEAAHWPLPLPLMDAAGKKRGELRTLVKRGSEYVGLAMVSIDSDLEALRPAVASGGAAEDAS